MEWYEITYSTKDGKESWIYFKSNPKKYKSDGEKKYKSFTYGWKIKTTLKTIKPIRNHEDFTHTTRKRASNPSTPKRRTTRKKSVNVDERAGNSKPAKASNRSTKNASANPAKPKSNKSTPRTTRSKSVSKPKRTTTRSTNSVGRTKSVSKSVRSTGNKSTTRTGRSASGVSNTTRSNSKSNRHSVSGRSKNPRKSRRSTD